MFITSTLWADLSIYLFTDLKLSTSKGSAQSLKSKFFILADYFSTVPFNRTNFNTFIQGMIDKGYRPAYVNNFIKFAKHIDKFYGINEIQDYTYFKEHRNRNVDIFTPDEIRQIAELYIPYRTHAKEINARNKAMYYLMGTTGMRIGELLKVEWANLFTDYLMLYGTKNGDDRPVPLPKFVVNLLKDLPRSGSFIFNVRDDSEINQDLKRRCKILGIKKQKISCHIFRHSFITTMITQNQVSVLQIAKIVGHHDVKTTYQTYSHLLIEDLRNTQSYHPLCREEATIESISKKIKDFTNNLIDKDKYIIQITEGVDFQLKLAHK